MIEALEKYPTPGYLLGSLIEDGVDLDLAERIANGYAKARLVMSDAQTHKWLNAMIANLGPMGQYPSTAMTVLCLPSEAITPHYNDVAATAGWKENSSASTKNA